MWLFRNTAILILLSGVLNGCGFKPLYWDKGSNSHVSPEMSSIYIERLSGRIGQLVRNHLLDMVTPKGTPQTPKYRLSVKISETVTGLAIEQDDTVTRNNYALKANYFLKKPGSNEIIHKGHTRSIASYNIVESDFANLNALKNAEKRTARAVSEEIKTQLAIYFSRQ